MARGVHRASSIYTVQYAILAERSSDVSLCDIEAISHDVTHSSSPMTKLFKPSPDYITVSWFYCNYCGHEYAPLRMIASKERARSRHTTDDL
jgi:hypothetical protein